MPLNVFLNDLSLPSEHVTEHDAIGFLKSLVDTVRAASRIDSNLMLYCHVSINILPLGHGVSVAAIRNSSNCVEECLYLKTLQARSPLDSIFSEIRNHEPESFEYKLSVDALVAPGERADALGYSHLVNGLAISINTHEFWGRTSIRMDKHVLCSNGNIQVTSVMARNLCRAIDIVAHEAYIRAFYQPTIHDGSQMWNERAVLFPNLRFIPRTREQIRRIQHGERQLRSVSRKLLGIDHAIGLWRTAKTTHPLFPFYVRPESPTRMQLVEFNDQNGNAKTFSDHADFGPGTNRIHFILETDPERHALIGHVGRKLGIG